MRLVNGRYDLDFIHDTAFVDIATDLEGNKIETNDTLLPFDLRVVGADAYKDRMLEVRVVDKASSRLVGLHRQGRANAVNEARITGILDEETPYEVSVYVDANENGKYDSGDPAWRVDLVSGSDGLTSTLDLGATAQTAIDTGEP
jgi:hypothetical protein